MLIKFTAQEENYKLYNTHTDDKYVVINPHRLDGIEEVLHNGDKFNGVIVYYALKTDISELAGWFVCLLCMAVYFMSTLDFLVCPFAPLK